MMVGKENPLDVLDANVLQMIEHAAIAKVDEQRGVAVPQDIHVAGVGPDRQVRRQPGKRSKAGGKAREAEARQDRSQR